LTGAEAVVLPDKLMAAIAASALTAEQKKALQDYLKPTKRESAKSIWAMGVEVFKAIGPWVGLAAGVLGL
jgi:predicted benzoate:H+ symporter BenE